MGTTASYLGNSKKSINLTINGTPHTISNVPADTSLNVYICDYAKLRGTKAMCHEGGERESSAALTPSISIKSSTSKHNHKTFIMADPSSPRQLNSPGLTRYITFNSQDDIASTSSFFCKKCSEVFISDPHDPHQFRNHIVQKHTRREVVMDLPQVQRPMETISQNKSQRNLTTTRMPESRY